MDEMEKILRRHGYTVDSFEDAFIEPLKKSETVEIIEIIGSSQDFKWLIDAAFRYFDMHVGVKHKEGPIWLIFVEEQSLAEIYFGKFN